MAGNDLLIGADVVRDLRLMRAVPGLYGFLYYDGRTIHAMRNRGELVSLTTRHGHVWWTLAEIADAACADLGEG